MNLKIPSVVPFLFKYFSIDSSHPYSGIKSSAISKMNSPVLMEAAAFQFRVPDGVEKLGVVLYLVLPSEVLSVKIRRSISYASRILWSLSSNPRQCSTRFEFFARLNYLFLTSILCDPDLNEA